LDAQASVPPRALVDAASAAVGVDRDLGFAVLNVVALDLGLPDIWTTVISGALLAASVAVVTRTRSAVAPDRVFLAVLATHAAFRLGGLPAFLAFEGC